MGVSFFIKTKRKEQVSVYCSLKFTGTERIIFKVPDLKINPKDWDNGWIRTGRGKQNNSYVDTILRDLKSRIEGFNLEFFNTNKKYPTQKSFIQFINSGKDVNDYFPKEKVFSVVPKLDEIIKRRSSGMDLNRGKMFSTGIIKQYNSALKSFMDYGIFRKSKLTNLEVLDKKFMEGFGNFLTIQKQMQVNTVGNKLKRIKSLLQELVVNDVLPFNPYIKYRIPIPHEESDNIALEEQELTAIQNLDLSDNPRLDNARDLFLILCWTGLRISDLKAFGEIPKDQQIITIRNKKTGDLSQIPIFPVTRQIIEKYPTGFPKIISEQKLRDYVKEVCQMIDLLNRSIEKTYTKGGKRVREIKKRWELVSLHTARRTFSTLMASKNIPYHDIMLVTGHKTLKSFQTYLKSNKEKSLMKMIEVIKS